ncbi:MAG: sulfatase-like hydrolase/transferase [Phycisphaera sp.]|nr:sulfatase-like hydrolase/transferase [Phycisphaera sp.]
MALSRILIVFTLAALTLLSFATPRPCCAADAPPNVIIFIGDDVGVDEIGAYGHPHIRTPNIDRLASQGVRFDRAFLTCSSCSPSRCSTLTGRYPHSTHAGELHLPLPKDQVLLTTPLREAGYWTMAIGKWHLGNEVKDQVDDIRDVRPEGMGDLWVKALRERPKDKPFFMWAAHHDSHRPYGPKDAVTPPHTHADIVVPPYLPDTPVVREDLRMYYDEISRFDEHIGMALAELERQGVADNTFILVMSDNGRPFPRCKTTVYDSGVRTPFIVKWPGVIKPGTVSTSLISTVDIAPTVLAIAGLKPLESFQGVSLMPVLHDPTATVRQYAHSEHNWHDYAALERGIRSARFTYIHNWRTDLPGTPPADAVTSTTFREMLKLKEAGKLTPEQMSIFVAPRVEEELYDTAADPHALKNLAADPAYADVMKAMRDEMRIWREGTDDDFDPQKITPDGFDRTTGKRMIKAAHPSFVK